MEEYLVALDEKEARKLERKLFKNLQDEIKKTRPTQVTPDGIIGENALTGNLEPDKCITTVWDEPVELEDGSWGVVNPNKVKLRVNKADVLIPDTSIKKGVTEKVDNTIKRKRKDGDIVTAREQRTSPDRRTTNNRQHNRESR